MIEWLQSFNNKKITVEDIISFCALSCISFRNSEEMYKESQNIKNPFLKTSILIIAMEELSKPLLILEILPALYEKYKIDSEDIKKFLNNFYSHTTKQGAITNYGKVTGKLGYRIFFTEEEYKKLDYIKQSGFYTNILNRQGEIHIPYNSFSVSNKLIKKIESFVLERLKSLSKFGYSNPGIVLAHYINQSLFNKKEVKAQKYIFLEDSDLSTCNTLRDLNDVFIQYEQIPKNGEIYVDEHHPDSSAMSMILMAKPIIKRKIEGTKRNENEGLMVVPKNLNKEN
ncbi:MAG: AbiV family abortive infection protein, partial [Ignavibacteriae bacterium]|nr:AbiV family abortive infection protein [Ignavibacteriota bacterium]